MNALTVLIVHGDQAASQYLRNTCERPDAKVCSAGAVFAPSIRPLQTIDVTSDRLVRKAKLQDNLYDKIQFFYSEVDKYHLARIDATVSVGTADGDGAGENVFWLDAPSAKVDSNGKPAAQGTVRPVTMIGDLKLSALAVLLNESGIEAKFNSGVLVCCQGRVMLQKSTVDNQIEMHGALCPDYYAVRDLLYSQFDMF